MHLAMWWLLVLVLTLLVVLVSLNWTNLRVNLLNFLTVKRGLVTVDCFWWRVSNVLLRDSAGVELYRELKARHGPYVHLNLIGTPVVLLTDERCIRHMLEASPNVFCTGELKYRFFKPFMQFNVGVSKGCPWARRRKLNERALASGGLHPYAPTFHHRIGAAVRLGAPLTFADFGRVADIASSAIVFGTQMAPRSVFAMFSAANSVQPLLFNDFALPPKLLASARRYMWDALQSPRPRTLVAGAHGAHLEKEELIDQVPHWVFPIRGVVSTVSARTLALLCNCPGSMSRLVDDLRAIDLKSAQAVYSCRYLRSCVLECLRLNNLVTSSFRTACVPVRFFDGTRFPAGTQFLVLNNPLLRRPECFEKPDSFRPARWTAEMEKDHCAMMFNHGPQECPGKELSIFIIQSMVANCLGSYGVVAGCSTLTTQSINTENVPQMINACDLVFKLHQVRTLPPAVGNR